MIGATAALAAPAILRAAPSGTPVKVGGTLSLTGFLAQTAVIHKISAEMMVEEINKRNGLLGRPVEFVLLDDQSKPEVARSLYEAWEASKRKLYQRQDWERIHMTSLWYRALWEEERAVAGDDIYAWGFKKSRHELEIMLRYAHHQALTPRQYSPEELFWPSTLDT